MKYLMRRVRLCDDERIALLDHTALQLGAVAALIGQRFGRALQILAASRGARLAHRNTPCDSSSATRTSLRPHNSRAMPAECSPMFGARYGLLGLREKVIGVRICPNLPSRAWS